MSYRFLFSIVTLSLVVLTGCEQNNLVIKTNPNPIIHNNLVVTIEKSKTARFGESITLDVTLDDYSDSGFVLGMFDVYLSYDLNALTFDSLTKGEMLSYCGWWYFASRHYIDSIDGNEVGAVTFVSFSNQHSYEANCYTPTDSSTNQIAQLHFTVKSNDSYKNKTVPLQFMWRDCNDNLFYSSNGQIKYMSNQVIQNGNDVSTNSPYPNHTGYNSICDSIVDTDRVDFYRTTDFVNGSVKIR